MASYVFALAPAATIWFSQGYGCGPNDEYAWLINIVIAASLGASGWAVGDTTDTDAQALFYAIVFMMGSGWVIASRFCTRPALALYALLSAIASLAYIVRCMKTTKTFAWVAATPTLFWASMYCFLRFADLLRK